MGKVIEGIRFVFWLPVLAFGYLFVIGLLLLERILLGNPEEYYNG